MKNPEIRSVLSDYLLIFCMYDTESDIKHFFRQSTGFDLEEIKVIFFDFFAKKSDDYNENFEKWCNSLDSDYQILSKYMENFHYSDNEVFDNEVINYFVEYGKIFLGLTENLIPKVVETLEDIDNFS